MKNIFLLSFLILLFGQAIAQDNIILRNGEEIKTKVIEITPTEIKYKKWNQDNPTYSILKRDVFMIIYENGTKEVFKTEDVSNNEIQEENKNEFKQKGFSNITEIHAAFRGNNIYCFQTVTGYQFSPMFNAGVGIGLDYYNEIANFQSMIPLFADVRFNFLKGRVTPYIVTAGGYSIIYADNNNSNKNITYKGGLLLNPSLGVKVFVSKKVALNFSIGYRMQKYSYEYKDYYYSPYTYKGEYTLSFINIKTGINF